MNEWLMLKEWLMMNEWLVYGQAMKQAEMRFDVLGCWLV